MDRARLSIRRRSSTLSRQRLTSVLVPDVGHPCLHARHTAHLRLPAVQTAQADCE